jgi:hypothetical protein
MVGVGVMEGVRVMVGVGVPVEVGVRVLVDVGEEVRVNVGVSVGLGVLVGLGVEVAIKERAASHPIMERSREREIMRKKTNIILLFIILTFKARLQSKTSQAVSQGFFPGENLCYGQVDRKPG